MGFIQTNKKNFGRAPHELVAIEVQEAAGYRGETVTLTSGMHVNGAGRRVYRTSAAATAHLEERRKAARSQNAVTK